MNITFKDHCVSAHVLLVFLLYCSITLWFDFRLMSHLKEKNSQERVSLVCYDVLSLFVFDAFLFMWSRFFFCRSMLYPANQSAAYINVKTNHLCILTHIPTALRYIHLDGHYRKRVCLEKGCWFHRHNANQTRCVCCTSEKKTIGKKKNEHPHQTPITRRVPL